MAVNFDNIPEQLRIKNNWVMWNYVERDGKKTKVPYQISGKTARSSDPLTWCSFSDAADNAYGFDGIGFVLTEDSGIVGIDFDHVIEDGTVNEAAMNEVERLDSYTEVSPSGEGIHVFVLGKKTDDACKFKMPDETEREIYNKNRFLTITGELIGNCAEVKPSQDAIRELSIKWANLNASRKESPRTAREEPPERNVEASQRSLALRDHEIINICKHAKNADLFNELYEEGKLSKYAGDESAADQGLVNILAFYTQDKEQIDRIFRSSALNREKWETRPDYRERTIKAAIEGLSAVYTPRPTGRPATRVNVPFNMVADRIIETVPLFTMRDTQEIYLYKNGVYRADMSTSETKRLIRDTYQECYLEIAGNPDEVPAAGRKFIEEVIAYIQDYTFISRDEVDDVQGRYVNFKNGAFDLESWKFISHDPTLKMIAQSPVYYDPDATCPLIMEYLESCWLSKEEIDTLIEFAGYCLTTDVKYEKAMLLHGNGSNGKSVFINLLKTALGSDLCSGESLHDIETDKYRVARLYGKRLNAFPDLKDTQLKTNEKFLQMTGADKTLTGEIKFKSAFDFRSTIKLLFSANRPPIPSSDNYAYYRRWLIIHFPRTFEREEIDRNLIDKLTIDSELSGFINMLLSGLKRLNKRGAFTLNPDVSDIEQQYKLFADNVTAFADRCLIDSPDDESTEKDVVYQAYIKWCGLNSTAAINPKTFAVKLGKMGYNTFRKSVKVNGEYKRAHCYQNTVLADEGLSQSP